MTVQQGMDTVRIREIAGQVRTQGTQVTEVESRGTASAGVLRETWRGADAQRLLETWGGTAVPQLRSAAEMLTSLAAELTRQAEQQDTTSSTSGGGAANGPGAGPGTGPGSGPGSGPGAGPGSGPGSGPGTASAPATSHKNSNSYDVLGRDKDSTGIRSNRGRDGNVHHYDPLTNKRHVEYADGRRTRTTDPFLGTESMKTKDKTSFGNGWEGSRSKTTVTGSRDETTYKAGVEKKYGDNWGQKVKSVTDRVSSEPKIGRAHV